MSVALKEPMTLEAFLDWESRQEFKYEFDGFGPVAMVGVTVAHSAIQANLLGLLVTRLRGHRCRAHGSELKIQVAGRIRYPDAFIVCSPVAVGATVIDDPVVVFEILSPGTSCTDRIEKNQEYRATPSVQRYVILEQTRSRGHSSYAREQRLDGRHSWSAKRIWRCPRSAQACRCSEIYEGVPFPPDDRAAVSGA